MKIKANLNLDKEIKKDVDKLNKKFKTDQFKEGYEAKVKKKNSDIEINITSKKKFKPKN